MKNKRFQKLNLNPELLDLIYDVPLGNSQWTDVLKKLRDEVQALLGLMYVFPPSGAPIVFATEPDGDALWTSYQAHFWQVDPWDKAIKSKHSYNTMFSGDDLLDYKAFKKTAFYHDFWQHWGFEHTAGARVKTRTAEFVVGLPRPKGMPAYTPSQLLLVNYYVSHIKRALDLDGINMHSLPAYFYQSALNSRFGLTSAEASLVMALIQHDGLKHAANSIGRNYNTSKTQLASIFRKTETNSQMSLLKCILGK